MIDISLAIFQRFVAVAPLIPFTIFQISIVQLNLIGETRHHLST